MHLVAHTGERLEARRVAALEEMLALVSTPAAHDPRSVEPKPHVIAIDEVHFFAEGAVEPIRRLRARGIHIVVAGCDLDHFGDVFAPFDRLLPEATEVVRLSGTCSRCGAPSTHSERLVAATDRIIVGGAAEFVATCARCFRPSRRDA
jgi:thymidine kinase